MLTAALFGRFSQTTNPRPPATRIKPPRKMSPIGVPVFARVPVEARGCVPPPESDGVLVPVKSLVLGAGVVVVLSDDVLGVAVLDVVVVGVVVSDVVVLDVVVLDVVVLDVVVLGVGVGVDVDPVL